MTHGRPHGYTAHRMRSTSILPGCALTSLCSRSSCNPHEREPARRAARLPRRVLEAIAAAQPYKIGRAFRVHVSKEADLAAVRKLAAIKARSWTH